jgi:hypothetical protein
VKRSADCHAWPVGWSARVLLAVAAALSVGAMLTRGTAAEAAPAKAVSVTRPLGDSLLTTTSRPGGISELLRDRRTQRVIGGVVVDYGSNSVVVFDAKRKDVQRLTIAQAESVSAARQNALAKLPVPYAEGPLPFTRGTLTPLHQVQVIGGVKAEAWRYEQGTSVSRLWYPTSPASIPAAYKAVLAEQLPAGGAAVAGKVVLLAQPFDGKVFVTPASAPRVASLTAVRARPAFVLPRGLHRASLVVVHPHSLATAASVPASVRRLPVNLLQIHGVNPLVGYWGSLVSQPSSVSLRAGLDSLINSVYLKAPYVSGLAQYGIHPSSMGQSSVTIANPPFFDIGNSPTSATIISHVIGMASVQLDRFGDPAWTIFNQDSVPVVVMLVSANDVAVGSVGGYHLALPARGFAGTLGIAGFAVTLATTGPAGLLSTFDPFLPMIISPVVPLIVAKVPAGGNPSVDADNTGPVLTHELNETATDPWGPVVGWADPTKTPFLQANEIGDICSTAFPPIAPFAQTTTVHGALVSTYWSNHDNACVPLSAPPTLTVLGPATNQTLAPGLTIAVSARCTDPASGAALPVTWLVNGVPTPESPAGHLPPPAHGMSETVQASCASGTSTALGPAVTITGG